jgi:hypothetical protein
MACLPDLICINMRFCPRWEAKGIPLRYLPHSASKKKFINIMACLPDGLTDGPACPI